MACDVTQCLEIQIGTGTSLVLNLVQDGFDHHEERRWIGIVGILGQEFWRHLTLCLRAQDLFTCNPAIFIHSVVP